MNRAARLASALCLTLSLPTGAWAARPMIVDDARVVDHKACQVEAWRRDNRDGSHEWWALPACNFTGSTEVTLGGARTVDVANGSRTSDVVAQLKHLFRPLPDSAGFGLAAVAGNVRHPDEPGATGGPYVYGIASASRFGGRLVGHLNLGVTRDQVREGVRPTWGVGTEIGLIGTRLQFLAELFGVGADRPFTQVGLRWWVIENRLQLDATYGDRFLRSPTGERFLTIGVRVLTPAFLP